MEKRLKEKMDAISAFEKFCEENKTVWIHLEGFGYAMSLLKQKMAAIVITESEQERNNKGVTKTKNYLKIVMLPKIRTGKRVKLICKFNNLNSLRRCEKREEH